MFDTAASLVVDFVFVSVLGLPRLSGEISRVNPATTLQATDWFFSIQLPFTQSEEKCEKNHDKNADVVDFGSRLGGIGKKRFIDSNWDQEMGSA